PEVVPEKPAEKVIKPTLRKAQDFGLRVDQEHRIVEVSWQAAHFMDDECAPERCLWVLFRSLSVDGLPYGGFGAVASLALHEGSFIDRSVPAYCKVRYQIAMVAIDDSSQRIHEVHSKRTLRLFGRDNRCVLSSPETIEASGDPVFDERVEWRVISYKAKAQKVTLEYQQWREVRIKGVTQWIRLQAEHEIPSGSRMQIEVELKERDIEAKRFEIGFFDKSKKFIRCNPLDDSQSNEPFHSTIAQIGDISLETRLQFNLIRQVGGDEENPIHEIETFDLDTHHTKRVAMSDVLKVTKG
ncbi:MAG: hypothetical protein KDB07_13775, partial [Planctomycetes bacterium]|nr:hypothetical protein [Planctomycetota bacterium]